MLLLQIVGTANRDNVPDVSFPMFQATPAKRPRRESWSDKLTSATETIASALTTGKDAANSNKEHLNEVSAVAYMVKSREKYAISD